jgi:DNA polymerase type B, organellar and viral
MDPKAGTLQRKTIEIDAIYDIETEGWTTPVLGGLYRKGKGYEEFDWREFGSLARDIGAVEGSAWAHNGGGFDHLWWLDHASSGGVRASIRAAGSRVVEISSGKLRLLDSLALAKTPLRDFTRGLGVSKLDLGFRCRDEASHGPDCGGYCRISRRLSVRERSQLSQYLRADVDSLQQALSRLKEWGEAHDLDLAPTIGGAAWASARRMLGLPDAELSTADHQFARAAYKGGRNQVFRPYAEAGYEFDVNALYPAALAGLHLPVGTPTRSYGDAARRAYARGLPGCFLADVSVPEMWIPPLAVRCKDRNAYPTGDFSGTWTAIELHYAEELGCRIRNVRAALTWPNSANVFRPWVEKLWFLRANAEGGKSSPFGTFLKFYMNSLTGKLGMRPAAAGYLLNPTTQKEGREYLGKGLWKYEGAGVRKTKDGRWVAGAPCCHVEWAAYLTAWGRIAWHRQATAGGDDLIYGDTDSIFSIGTRGGDGGSVGRDLGEWEPKGTFRDFDAIAPKFYTYQPDHPKEGERLVDGFRIRSKGVKANFDDQWRDLWLRSRGAFAWSGPRGFRSAAATLGRPSATIFSAGSISRRISRGTGDRILQRDGTTRPPEARELRIVG